MKRFFTLLFVAISTLMLFLASSSSAPTGNTGAPGNSTCGGCHGGGSGTTNTTISFSGTTNTYKSDSTYTVTVNVSNSSYVSGSNKFGFSLLALNSSNSSVGTITAGTGSSANVSGGLTYLGHVTASNTKIWTFTWKAPSTAYTGAITFYVCGNATDGTGGTSGDQPGTYSITLTNANPTVQDINVKQAGANYVNTSTFNYGTITNNSNLDKIFAIQNVGANAAILSVSSVSLSGPNAAEFSIQTTPTVFNVNGGDSNNVTVRFTPTSAGAKSATLTITSNDPDENPYTITLNGTGQLPPPKISITQAGINYNTGGTFNYGNKKVNSNNDTVFILKNIGGQPLSYTGTPVVSGTNAANFSIFSINPIVTSIAAGDSVAVTIRFIPSSTGLRVASISIPTNDPLTNNYVLNLNGTGIAPDIEIKQNGTGIANAGNFNFGSINTSSFSDKIFDIKNTGNDTLFLTNSSFSGTNAADFSFQSSTTATIAPNATYNLTIRCTPGASGSRTAKCTLTSNDPDENPYEINLSATGSTAIIGVKQNATSIANAGNFNFGTSIINTGNSKTFTIENTGSDTLKFSGSSITGTNSTDFTTATNFNTLTVAPSSNVNFSITFTPTSIGNKTASISLSNNDVGNNPFVINLSGNGDSASDIHVQQSGSDYLNNSVFNYGNKLNGANHDVIFSVQNVQGVPLVVSSVTLTGTNASEFQIMPPVPTTVAKGSPSNCTVRFKPLTLGSKTANLVITSSDPDESPYTIVLNGNSVTPEINIKQGLTNINTGGLYNYSNTAINFDNDIVFTIENTGTDALSGILGTIIGANASDFVIINPPAISINASATTTITVRFRPTVAGARTATLNLSSNDADENPYLITLNGTGINLPAPNIDLSQAAVQITNNASYAFGAVATGGNIPVTFTITNSGDDTLRNILAKLSGTNVSEFKFTSQPAFKLDPGATSDFIITFSPLSASSRSAILKISSNDIDENPFTVNLTGSGNGPEIDVTSNNIPNPNNSTQPYPLTKTWASSPITFAIANKGNAILNNITVAILGKDTIDYFVDSITSNQIAPGSTMDVKVTFRPKYVGNNKQAEFVIFSDDADESVYKINLLGNAILSVTNNRLPELISLIRNENAIELKNNSGNSFNVKFYQIDGTMRFENILSESLNINTFNYPKGIYILELNDAMNRERYIQKIVIE